jgi:hypothetical protein
MKRKASSKPVCPPDMRERLLKALEESERRYGRLTPDSILDGTAARRFKEWQDAQSKKQVDPSAAREGTEEGS